MAFEKCYTCIKYLMTSFNFLFWLLGCALLGVGIWLKIDPVSLHSNLADAKIISQSRLLNDNNNNNNNNKNNNNNNNFNNNNINNNEFGKENFPRPGDSNPFPPEPNNLDDLDVVKMLDYGAYLFIGTGAVIMLLGFLGCCGAIKENQCMLVTFFLLLFVIFSILMTSAVFAITQKEKLKEDLSDRLTKSVLAASNGIKSARDFMDFLQKTLKCCGADHGESDYKGKPSNCEREYSQIPCSPKVSEFYSQNIVIFSGVAVGIAAALIMGMLFSMLLCCSSREQKQNERQF